jgi:sugar phosphate isomerase/epimerase
MVLHRRDFLMGVSLFGASAAVSFASAEEKKSTGESLKPNKRADLKISSQLSFIPGLDLEEKLANMEKWGFDGVELYSDVLGHEKKYLNALAKTKLKVSSLCWGSHDGDIVSNAIEKRSPALEDLRRVIESAGEMKSTGVIYVPAFNGETKLGNQEIREILVDVMPAIGEHALARGTRVLFEPVNRNEAFFLRQVADAAAICRDCESAGLGVVGDFYHMDFEETSDLGAFISGGKHVHHVQVSGRERRLPGKDDRDFLEGFKGLKYIGFNDFCSLECESQGDPKIEIPKAVKFLRQQWEKA